MEFADAYDKLISSQSFIEWRRGNEHCYLAHFFAELSQQLMPMNWEIGFYNPKKDVITTFTVNEMISLEPEAQVFKETDKVERLDINDVHLGAEDALHKAREFQMEKYPAHLPLKGIIILQNLSLGTVWNITFVTQAFSALNIKVDAGKGTVKSGELINLVQIGTDRN